jgi:hypothetical protein
MTWRYMARGWDGWGTVRTPRGNIVALVGLGDAGGTVWAKNKAGAAVDPMQKTGRLLAAAPDLLEAAEDAVRTGSLARLVAAIAKAKNG